MTTESSTPAPDATGAEIIPDIAAAPAAAQETATPQEPPVSFLSAVAGEDAAPEKEAPADSAADAGAESGDAPKAEQAEEAESDYDLAVPEGVPLDEDALAELKDLARAHKLSRESAQAVVELGVKLSERWTAAFEQAVATARAANRAAVEADPLFTGPDKDANLAAVARARRFVSTVEGLAELLDIHGLGDHPAVVKAFHKFGQALSEDTIVGSNAKAASPPLSLADRLYRRS